MSRFNRFYESFGDSPQQREMNFASAFVALSLVVFGGAYWIFH